MWHRHGLADGWWPRTARFDGRWMRPTRAEAGEAEARGAWLVAEVKRVGGEERGGEGSTTAEEGRGGIGGCIGRA